MKKLKSFFYWLLMMISVQATAQSPSFKTFVNPVIPGDHPDPTLTKIGDYFYTTGSSFNPTPRIHRSTDLVYWEVIAQPVPADWWAYGDGPGGGIWGGNIVFRNGKYWHFFGHWYTMWFVTADDPAGQWSQPVEVKKPNPLPSSPFDYGQDNSIYIDDDNHWYMLTKAGKQNNWIIELGDDGQPKVGGAVLDLRWLNPDSEGNPYGWAEGPVMNKYNGYYYYYVSKSAGTTQYVFRTATLSGDKSKWEFLGELYDQADKTNSLYSYPAHYSAPIQLKDGSWWAVCHSWANGKWEGQGRQGVLSQIRWNSQGKPKADYPNYRPYQAPDLPSGGVPWMVPKSDFFLDSKLNPEWSFLGKTLKSTWSLTERKGWLMLSPKEDRPNTLIKQDAERNYSLITRVNFEATGSDTANQAGLRLIDGNEDLSVQVFLSYKGGEKIIAFGADSLNKNKYKKNIFFSSVKNTIGDIVWLKMVRNEHFMSAFYSENGSTWTKLGNDYNVEYMDKDPNMGSWTGNHQGPYVKGDPSKKAFFNCYIYRDAYSEIPASYPANWYGTYRRELSANNPVLDSISTGDWAMFAGVEFGNGVYDFKANKFQVNLASTTTGGVIEIWLGSIGTGTKIGECNITNTGNINTYSIVESNISNTSGRHDVFLYFKNTNNCRIKSFKFIGTKNIPSFFAGVNFGGTSISLDLGSYTTAQMATKGLPNNDLSSLKVPAGYKVELFDGDNFTTSIGIYKADVADLNALGKGNLASSIKVSLISYPTSPVLESVTALSDKEIEIKWADSNTDETGFRIERSTDGASWTVAGTIAPNATKFTDTKLKFNTLYFYRVVAINGDGEAFSIAKSATTKFGVPLVTVPGRIEAEDYDLGKNGQSYFDLTNDNKGGRYRQDSTDIQTTSDALGLYNLAWVDATEWTNYTIDVPSDGDYEIVMRISGFGGAVTLKVDGTSKLNNISLQNSGDWNTWKNDTIGIVNLSKGLHTLQFLATKSGYNFNYFDVNEFVPESKKAYFFENTLYGGKSVFLTEGSYTTAQLLAKGIKNDDVSSLKVPSGYTVELYDGDNFTGAKYTLSSNEPDLVAKGFNDKTSSIRINGTVTGQEEVHGLERSVSIYPNPNNGKFRVMLPEAVSSKLELYNSIGQMVYHGTHVGATDIQLEGLSKGTYILKIKSGDLTNEQKVVID